MYHHRNSIELIGLGIRAFFYIALLFGLVELGKNALEPISEINDSVAVYSKQFDMR